MNDRYQRLRDALAAGPTPGPREAIYDHPTSQSIADIVVPAGDSWPTEIVTGYAIKTPRERADIALMAAADPETIAALIAERDAMREALVIAREYVADEIAYLKNAFRGHEELGRVPEAEADLARVDAALENTDAR